MSVATKIASGYALALAALVILGGLSYWSTNQLIAINESVARTHKTVAELEALLSLLKDAETGQRGFLLTGKESYLQPYRDARVAIDSMLDDLSKMPDRSAIKQLRA